MSNQLLLTGMVLRSAPSGEYDRRVVLLTKERGRITAFARGARRPKSSLLAATSPFSFGTFTLYEGATAYTLAQADIHQYFAPVREDLEASCYGSYFMEMADYYARENLDASQMLNLLYVSLKALEKPSLEKRLIRRIFEIRLMVINGEFPYEAAERDDLHESAAYAISYSIKAPLQKLYSFRLTPEVLDQMEKVTEQIRQKTIDRPMHSLEVLKSLCE